MPLQVPPVSTHGPKDTHVSLNDGSEMSMGCKCEMRMFVCRWRQAQVVTLPSPPTQLGLASYPSEHWVKVEEEENILQQVMVAITIEEKNETDGL